MVNETILNQYRKWYSLIPEESRKKKGDSPPCMGNIASSIFSIAKHYGGCTIGGTHYIYIPSIDVIFRDDVWEEMKKQGARLQ